MLPVNRRGAGSSVRRNQKVWAAEDASPGDVWAGKLRCASLGVLEALNHPPLTLEDGHTGPGAAEFQQSNFNVRITESRR
jgi:hypothetical protein